MAHWIIDDHGFGGQYYKCSECGAGFWDIFDDVCGEEACPKCKSPINEDENVYTENWKVGKDLPYTRNRLKNLIVTNIMNDWKQLVVKAKKRGMRICFAPGCEDLELYFNDDYPDMILVDKAVSCKKGE